MLETSSQFSTWDQSAVRFAPCMKDHHPKLRILTIQRTPHVNAVHVVLLYLTVHIFSTLQVKNKPREEVDTFLFFLGLLAWLRTILLFPCLLFFFCLRVPVSWNTRSKFCFLQYNDLLSFNPIFHAPPVQYSTVLQSDFLRSSNPIFCCPPVQFSDVLQSNILLSFSPIFCCPPV